MEQAFWKGFRLRLGSFAQKRSESVARDWLHFFPSLFAWLVNFFRLLHRSNFITRRKYLEWEIQSCCSMPFTLRGQSPATSPFKMVFRKPLLPSESVLLSICRN